MGCFNHAFGPQNQNSFFFSFFHLPSKKEMEEDWHSMQSMVNLLEYNCLSYLVHSVFLGNHFFLKKLRLWFISQSVHAFPPFCDTQF